VGEHFGFLIIEVVGGAWQAGKNTPLKQTEQGGRRMYILSGLVEGAINNW